MPRAPIRVLSSVCALVLATAPGGCGKDSLSANELRTQATGICLRTATAAERIALPASEDGGAQFLHAGLAQLRPALARLEQLKPPSDLRDSYEQALHVRRQEIALIGRTKRTIAHGEDAVATFRSLQASLAPLESLEGATWRALQIPACAPR
jgi:hypothetical protein